MKFISKCSSIYYSIGFYRGWSILMIFRIDYNGLNTTVLPCNDILYNNAGVGRLKP
ncbi:hypothetical protein [Flavobacterium sp. FlaQc-48]|uniref:hypothetical protein n=1 Tax=Flavobacterium sp. FlaQc-48 TaxID=3374181 RepID=UPI0037579435